MSQTEYRPAEASDPTATVDFDKTPPPARFRLKAQLVDQGSQSWVLAESGNLQIKIRVYAPHEGENAMHAHHNQEHSFVVLQGNARFYGPRGEAWELGHNEGIMLPEGTYYSFENCGDDPLVVLRIMSAMPENGDPDKRLGIHGEQIEPHSPENKRPDTTVFRDGEFYE